MSKVLVIDDSVVFREAIRGWLVEGGHTVIGEAENGEEGIEKFKELRPEITILDINMPIMHGLDALKKIMAIDPDTHVLMISTEGGKDGNIPESFLHGACEFIEKPVDKELFNKTISHIVRHINKSKKQ